MHLFPLLIVLLIPCYSVHPLFPLVSAVHLSFSNIASLYLKHLSLSKNHIMAEGAQRFAEALSVNKTLMIFEYGGVLQANRSL